jgi:hypothetical protein
VRAFLNVLRKTNFAEALRSPKDEKLSVNVDELEFDQTQAIAFVQISECLNKNTDDIQTKAAQLQELFIHAAENPEQTDENTAKYHQKIGEMRDIVLGTYRSFYASRFVEDRNFDKTVDAIHAVIVGYVTTSTYGIAKEKLMFLENEPIQRMKKIWGIKSEADKRVFAVPAELLRKKADYKSQELKI